MGTDSYRRSRVARIRALLLPSLALLIVWLGIVPSAYATQDITPEPAGTVPGPAAAATSPARSETSAYRR